MIYGYLDKNIKAQNHREIGGVRIDQHFRVEELENVQEQYCIPTNATAVVVHGVLRNNAKVIREATRRGIDWYYIDNGYLGTYKRFCKNSTAPDKVYKGDKPRFEHNTKFQKWRGGQGENIIVLPPSPPYMDTFDQRDFLNYCAHNINIYTGKPIIVRAKPAKGRFAPPWEEQLKNAYCVVTWGSALALDAMIQGVPTISLGWCPAGPASKQLEDLETNRMLEEPDREAIVNNLTWFSYEKNELSQVWDSVAEVYETV